MSAGAPLPAFHKLTANRQLALLRMYPGLAPRLCRLGLSAADALAVAYNATLLYFAVDAQPPLRSPAAVLDRYSLGEIAELCALFGRVEAGQAEYGHREGDTK